MTAFDRAIAHDLCGTLCGVDLSTLQVNVGLMCNQACRHCHLACSPQRTEIMPWPVMEAVVEAADACRPERVDLTGGAPELNPDFRQFVVALRDAGHEVQVRTNLTVLLEPGQEDTAQFLAEHSVALVGSMPCYLEENVDTARGQGAYRRSVESMKRLNALGYGTDGGLQLDLVYNPAGPFLPPGSAGLEADYKRELAEHFGITFTRLIAITNMPIGRFRTELERQGEAESYMRLLRDSYNPGTLPGLMCRHQLSIGWDGTVYDCDFNLALGLSAVGKPVRIQDADLEMLVERQIVTGEHCFGCTAGAGSSCGGQLVSEAK